MASAVPLMSFAVSAQTPERAVSSNIATGGSLELTVTNSNGTSAVFHLNVNPIEPGLLAPAQFRIGTNQYVVAVVMYGVGFGEVTPSIPAGKS